jgi:small nuclear ribonucleoprotein (snRNP)-like protein
MNILCKPWVCHWGYTSQKFSFYCYSENLPKEQIIVKKAVLVLSGDIAYKNLEGKTVEVSFNDVRKLFSGHIVLFDKIENIKLEEAKKIELQVTLKIGQQEKTINYLITPSVRTYLIQR